MNVREKFPSACVAQLFRSIPSIRFTKWTRKGTVTYSWIIPSYVKGNGLFLKKYSWHVDGIENNNAKNVPITNEAERILDLWTYILPKHIFYLKFCFNMYFTCTCILLEHIVYLTFYLNTYFILLSKDVFCVNIYFIRLNLVIKKRPYEIIVC